MEKKIYLIKFDNGEEYDDYEEFTYSYCYSDLARAEQEIKKLEKDKKLFEEEYLFRNADDINIWYEQVTLIEK